MRKYELIFAFILALILMLLASCKSKQVTINEQVDSVSVSRLSLADIRSQMLDFSFDSMCFEVDDTCVLGEVKGRTCNVKVMGGRIKAESLESRAECNEKKDSVRVKSEYHAEKIAKPSGWNYRALSFVALIVIIMVFLYVKRHIG